METAMKPPCGNNPLRRAFFTILAIVATLLIGAGDEKQKPSANLKNALKSITAKELREHVAYLASDALEGRRAGTAGEDKAADYIAKEFARLKLKHLKDHANYFQEFDAGGQKGKNVIAIMEGSDDLLKDEYVIIGGHHDHMGKAPPDGDNIFNGADDNASGVAAILEIAEAFVEQKVATKRSVIFITFSAEEMGLLGSKYYTEHLPFPLEAHAAMINLDMIGRNPDKPMRVSGVGTCRAWEQLANEASKECKVKCLLAPGFTGTLDGNTDHEPFARAAIPVLCFFTGYHDDYHKASDQIEKLDFNRMEKIAQMAFMIVDGVADMAEKPKFTLPEAKEKK